MGSSFALEISRLSLTEFRLISLSIETWKLDGSGHVPFGGVTRGDS